MHAEAPALAGGSDTTPLWPGGSGTTPPEASHTRHRRQRACFLVGASILAAAACLRSTRVTTGATAMSRDRRTPMRDVKPLSAALADNHSDVVTFPALTTKYVYLPAADGRLKVFASWNGGVQAPTRRVRVNQTVRVTVENSLYDQEVSVHHHGVHQVGTPYYDGTQNIAQPGLSSGQTMTYEFRAWPAGTHWYHSHTGLTEGDGLKGMFIVEDPDDPWRHFYSVDEALMFYEWNWQTQLEMWEAKQQAPYTPQTFEAGIVNGIVSKNRSGVGEGYVVNVGAGRTARLRLCYPGFNFKSSVTIAEHNMTVIAKDGASTAPLTTARIVVHAGERYDVLVRASNVPGDYTINFEMTIHGLAADPFRDNGPNDSYEGEHNETLYAGHFNATLRVHAVDADTSHAGHRELALPPSPFVDEVQLATATRELHSAEPTATDPVPLAADRQIPIVVTAQFGWVQKGESDHISAAPASASSTGAWMFNNISWVDPTAPLYLTKGKCCTSTGKRYATNVVDVEYNEVVDLVVIQNGRGSTVEYHPLHLHGYRFWVVASGPLPYNESNVEYNLINPLHADTWPIRTGYYYVLRLRANNPGYWHLHCHLVYHMYFGLQMVLNVGERHQPDVPTEYIEAISQFPGEYDSLLALAAKSAAPTAADVQLARRIADDGADDDGDVETPESSG